MPDQSAGPPPTEGENPMDSQAPPGEKTISSAGSPDELAGMLTGEQSLQARRDLEALLGEQTNDSQTIPEDIWSGIAPQQQGEGDNLNDIKPVTPQEFLGKLDDLLNNTNLSEEQRKTIYESYVEIINQFQNTAKEIEKGTRPKALTMGLKKSLLKIISTFAFTKFIGITSSPAGGVLLAISTALTTLNTLRGNVDQDTKIEKRKDEYRKDLAPKYQEEIGEIERQLAQILKNPTKAEQALETLTSKINQLEQSWQDAQNRLKK